LYEKAEVFYSLNINFYFLSQCICTAIPGNSSNAPNSVISSTYAAISALHFRAANTATFAETTANPATPASSPAFCGKNIGF
jgi:hypothetical protein